MLEVIDSSLPLIGRANAAKLLFAPDHHSLVLVRNPLWGSLVTRVVYCLRVRQC